QACEMQRSVSRDLDPSEIEFDKGALLPDAGGPDSLHFS
ncbi:uncharacterized protein METZ01_LOCUS372814, partial [marine metagenome]